MRFKRSCGLLEACPEPGRRTEGSRPWHSRQSVPATRSNSTFASHAASETVVIQWVIAPATTAPVQSDGTGVVSGLRQRVIGGNERPDPEVLKAARDKVSAPLFRAVGRVGVQSEDPARIGHLLWRV